MAEEAVSSLLGALKRPRSPSDDGDIDAKRSRQTNEESPFNCSNNTLGGKLFDFAVGATGLKRARSTSPTDEDAGAKRLRQSDDFFSSRLVYEDRKNLSAPFDTAVNSKKVPLNGQLVSSLNLNGLKVNNLVIATVTADGTLVELPFGQTQSPPITPPLDSDSQFQKQEFISKKLDVKANTLSPPITPAANDKQNPLDRSYGGPIPYTETSFNKLPTNYVIMGDIALFGHIPAKLHIFQGAVTKLHPYAEVIRLSTNQVTIGSVLPDLKDGPFDAIILDSPEFCYQAVKVHGYEMEGVYFKTDVMFKGPLQPVSDIIRDVFHQDKPALHVSTYLGRTRDWMKPHIPSWIVLRGSFENCSVNIWDVVEFTQIGLELSLDRSSEDMRVGYGFFGKANIAVPGSVVPLQTEYLFRIVDEDYMLFLTLKDDDWKDCFGIKGLTLSEVNFVGILSEPSSSAYLFLRLEAVLQLNGTMFRIAGSYSKDEYSLEAYVGNLSLQDVGKIFQQITGCELDVFDHYVVFDSLNLIISSEGLTLSGAITINGHSSAYGTISIQRDGLHISGGIGNVEFENLTIESAGFDVFIGSKSDGSSTRSTKFAITGELKFCGLDLKVGLFTEKAGSDFLWTIYGEVQGDMSVGRLHEDFKGSFLDVSLSGLALIASNKKNPDGSFNKFRYPVREGIQFCAVIESIPQLEDLMRGSVKGTILSASYSKGGLRLGLILPAKRTISFGDRVYTGPLALEIVKEGLEIQLVLKAELNVKVDTQIDPLKFSLGLKASYSGASAYAQMMNDWVNPCNIGKNVVVRGCALEFGIVYATFFTTGMPGAIGVAGEISIGKKAAKVAMKLSQNPKEQILAAAVKDLGVVDLVKFASLICEYDFPEPDDFLHFNDMELYLSTGASIGETYYPPGASLKGDMTIFGKKAKFNCTIGTMVKIMATIEHFDLGPLKVKGATGPDPIVDIELSADKQKVLIDGAVELWALKAALHLEAEVYPKPKFDFWVDVSLDDWFKFKLQAKLTGDINFKDLKTLANADFEVYALMEQHIIENIVKMLDKQINSMHENSDFEEAKRRLTEKENQYNVKVQDAQTKLTEARTKWQTKQATVTAEYERAKEEAATYRQRIQDKATESESIYKQFIASAITELERVRHVATAAISSTESELAHVQHDTDESTRQAQNDLHRKLDEFQTRFGSARDDLENARKSVEQAQVEVDLCDKEISDIDRQISEASFWDTPTLVAERATKSIEQIAANAALEATRAIFSLADAVVQSAEFVEAGAAIDEAVLTLETVMKTNAIAVETARTELENVKKAQEPLIKSAVEALSAAKADSAELAAYKVAIEAVASSESVAQSMISSAESAFKSFDTCVEFLAVGAAEKELAAAQSSTAEVELARQACSLVEEHSSSFADDILDVGLNIAKWLAEAAGEIINITKIEFSGSISSLIADGPPLIVNIEGKLMGNDIDIHINWQPHFNFVKFIKAIFSELWEKIKDFAGKFLEEIGAKIVELAEDIAEGVVEGAKIIGEGLEEAGEAIAEGAEKVGEALEDAASEVGSAINDAASEIGHVADDVADGINDAASEVGSAINDAASEIGHAADDVAEGINEAASDVEHAVEDVAEDIVDGINDAANEVEHAVENVAEDIDDAMSDVGSFVEDAANDVGHAVEDFGNGVEEVANDVGNAVNDFGNDVENVANDIGNAISDAFSFW